MAGVSEKKRRASMDSAGKRKTSFDFGKRRGSLSIAKWFKRDKEVGFVMVLCDLC